MANFNKVILIGNLTREPELRFSPSGLPVGQFGLAINRRYRDSQDNLHEEVTFIEINAWGRLAELCAEYLSKGSPVLVEGRLQQDRWQTKEGELRSQLKVIAEQVRFLPRSERTEVGPGQDEEEVPF